MPINRNGEQTLIVIMNLVLSYTNPASKVRAPRCMACNSFGVRYHACLDCVYFGCWHGRHIQQHSEARGHRLAIDLTRLELYCFHCKDYVYDDRVEKVFEQPYPRIESARAAASQNLIISLPQQGEGHSTHHKEALWHCTPRRNPTGLVGLRGMLNLGNTCFMNVVLQTLVHNPPIRDYFLEDRHNRQLCPAKGDSLCLACDMDLIIESAFSGSTEPFAPHQFLHAMWSHASHLAGYDQQDAHEFLISLLDGLHLRCGGTPVDCKCIVHRTFGGQFRSVVTCLGCGSTYFAFDPLLEIAVDLAAIHNHSSVQPQTLFDCLESFTKPERLSDKFFCRKCETHQPCTKQLSIQSLPAVLTVHLKRFKHLGRAQTPSASTKLDNFIAFPADHLDLGQFVSQEATADGGKPQLGAHVYKLFAVVEHKGSVDSGHYISYVRREHSWFKCDDAVVTRRSEREVLSSPAYMLFYQQVAPERST
ncbi:unnamed protein product (mitochondrion) [Plasmodiophora brassicae]|uniref:Ubiquitin carboxyl-terminal hydrolase n=1 Tax=Plasmodiophora brassicae TaxID=37360 RepID=A0A3P3Y0E1_PLABS|nr:unnamed protein product [Plasmodiophora brassicae]